MDNYNKLKNLHNQDNGFVLGNVWNAQSALLFQKLGYKAVGTSSAAVATSLGYEDGEKMPFGDLLRIVKNIQSKIKIPLTVDIEGGYSRNETEILNNITELYKLGVVGINIEDSISEPERKIVDSNEFGKCISKIKSYLSQNSVNMFVNVRTDHFIMGLPNALDNTLQRIKIYEENGADGIFVPGIVAENDIKEVINCTNLPVNVMCMPNLPNFNRLQELGVKRISYGPFLYTTTLSKLEKSISEIDNNKSFNSIFL